MDPNCIILWNSIRSRYRAGPSRFQGQNSYTQPQIYEPQQNGVGVTKRPATATSTSRR